MLLSVDRLTKQFGQFTVLNDLSFEVPEGSVFGIAGPNGAGKTTLFNVITGFYPYHGTITFNGTRIQRLGPHAVCRLGIARTFQMPFLFNTMTVYQNILVGAQFGNREHKRKDEVIRKMLDFTGLKGKEELNAAGVKIYDKKLIMLAAALATNPKLLLLDEPVAGLSPVEADEFIALVKRINTELGVTIIVIEHLMRVLLEISNSLMILDNGEKICFGPPREVVNDPKVLEVYLGGGDA